MTDLRYPIGEFEWSGWANADERARMIEAIALHPLLLRAAIRGLSEDELNTPYRDGGWTVRQVIHHLADSHMNSYIRCRLALTEPAPTIKPYDEVYWAELEDARSGPVELSLVLLEALHARWVILLKSLRDEDFAREYRHPESGLMTIDKTVALYSWHGAHHIAHVTELRKRMRW